MKRIEFERATPESVGIPSDAVEKLLDGLESGITEMHGIQIMRFGKICAEGWWNPYAPGIRHNLMSVTKTYTSTAIGIAYTEGLLKLSDRIIDIFPEEAPEQPGEHLQKLTIRDVLCMGCGMESMPEPSKHWIRDFLATPVVHLPGSKFMYNSVASSLLGVVIKKLTGLGLHEYLRQRLFEKIGIDPDNLRWGHMPDGIEAGGAGLYATTEDNLRLMKLYADGGIADGGRILSPEYIRYATSVQIDSSIQAEDYPFAKDSFYGYGFQIWMCKPRGGYRADGAMGQFSVVLPGQDMQISLNQTGKGIDGPQKTLDVLWDFTESISSDKPLPEDPAASSRLQKRLSCLSLPRPACRPFSPFAKALGGVFFKITEGILRLEEETLSKFCGSRLTAGISQFRFHFSSDIAVMEFLQDGVPFTVSIALTGTRALNELRILDNVATLVYLSGSWAADNIFSVIVRWIETSFEKEMHFCFDDKECTVTIKDPLMSYGPFGELDDTPVKAVRIN